MNITPFVYPSKDQEGVELSLEATALFDFALELGTINKHNAFLVKKTSEFSNNVVEPVESSVELQRIDLTTTAEHTTPDYGSDPNSGELYRSKIIIKPLSLLEQHTEYSVLLSKEISAVTVFDPEPGVGNVESTPIFKGPFTGLSDDVYTIDITDSGDHGTALFQWTRSSDSASESGLRARKRYVEIDKGIFIKFPRGNYEAGDTFTLRVRPQQKLNTTVTWDFATGSEAQIVPDDSRSTSVVDIPVVGQDDSGGSGTGGFQLNSSTPYDGQTMVNIGQKGSVVINGIVYTTQQKTDSLNNKRIKVIDLTGMSPTIYELNDEIVIEIEDGVTTNQEVVDIMNGSTFAIEATTSTPGSIATLHGSGMLITGGVNGGFIEFTFNKNIDQANFNESNISAIYESLTSVSDGDLDFSYEITDNKLKIQF